MINNKEELSKILKEFKIKTLTDIWKEENIIKCLNVPLYQFKI